MLGPTGERDDVLRGVEEQLERRLALDQVSGEAGADQGDDGAGRPGDEQRGEGEGGRGGDLALRSAGAKSVLMASDDHTWLERGADRILFDGAPVLELLAGMLDVLIGA